MPFKRYISHPARTDDGDPTLLIGPDGQFSDDGHLQTVARRIIDACRGQVLADGSSAAPVAKVVGLTHDFAKLTQWAQQHLRGQSFRHPKEYRYHEFPSALVTLYCLSEHHEAIGAHAAEVATLVVAGHHNLKSPPDPSQPAKRYGRDASEVVNTYERVERQFDDIDDHASDRADRIIRSATDEAGSWDEFRVWHDQRSTPIDGVHEHLRYFARVVQQPRQEGYYTDLLRLWTALKFADQTAASGLDESELGGTLPDPERLEAHVSALNSGEGIVAELNELRTTARREATRNVESIINSDSVGQITLPTGFGKTYAGLSAGLRAAQRCKSRLVYALPYTSILDQTAREIESIFEVSPFSDAFTLHHHLSETYTELGTHHTDADIGRSPGALHAESWLSGLTLTTTVQLFESLTAPTARQATRLPALEDAVVVVDEPQTIPQDWWQIVPRLIEVLVKQFDATVILMTATQPGLVRYGSDRLATQELTDSQQKYVDFLAAHSRVIYRLHDTVRDATDDGPTTIDYDTAGERVWQTASAGNDVLAVCNTRASAETLYECTSAADTDDREMFVELGRLLYSHVVKTGELPSPLQLRQTALDAAAEANVDKIYSFLSGNVRPDDRTLLIDTLYNDGIGDENSPDPLLDTDLSVVLISTSVVEAGVDVSFDTVFRDYAPIPNIVQSGGRCNRSFGGAVGEVVVWRLGAPEGHSGIPSLLIYGSDGGKNLPLLRETGHVLRRHALDNATIDEATMISTVVTDFYQALFEGSLDPGNESLVEAVDTASLLELEGKHMIDELEQYEDVIAGLTEQERDDLFRGDIGLGDIVDHPGTHVSTNPGQRARAVTVSSSTYLVLDARDDGYHPVFGVR